jgi:hypothetical protein
MGSLGILALRWNRPLVIWRLIDLRHWRGLRRAVFDEPERCMLIPL